MRFQARQRRRVHFWLMVVWFPQLFIVFLLPHTWQIPYLMICSVYANFVGHWGAYSAETPVEEEKGEA